MERVVPYTASDEVELYLRTYYSLLRSSSAFQIKTIEEAHSGMNSLLHPGARDPVPDMSAFIYCLLRLPDCIKFVNLVILGQSTEVFFEDGIGDIETWSIVKARARRRRCYFDGHNILASIIASRTDIDDILPLLTAYQIERRKLYRNLQTIPHDFPWDLVNNDQDYKIVLAQILKIEYDDLERLFTIWGDDFQENIDEIASHPFRIKVRLLSGSLSEYRRATHFWWKNIAESVPTVNERPIYFVSSNTHSLVNLLSGYASNNRGKLVTYLDKSSDENLLREWADIQAQMVKSNQENFLYYLLKKTFQTNAIPGLLEQRSLHEKRIGIKRIDSKHFFDVDAQVIELAKLNPEWIDPRLSDLDLSFLKNSNALILNIDYPLGLSAYNILSKISEQAQKILGIYIMGKAATLNGVIGDVMIPNVVHDEHSRNTYFFNNAINAVDVAPNLVYGTVLDNQKAVTVRGTFLQNTEYMDVFYREGYTNIEMEAGPYLSAVYELFRPKRHPVDEIINLYNLPFDLGILHYASDTPLSKGKNLGAATLSYFGMDPTYSTSLAILKRILYMESRRIGNI